MASLHAEPFFTNIPLEGNINISSDYIVANEARINNFSTNDFEKPNIL